MKTSKRKKNILFITILSIVGLIGAMALQMIWIYNSYELIKNDILNEGYATIEKALEEEGNMRFGKTPKGTEIMSGPTNDTIPPMTYFMNGFQTWDIRCRYTILIPLLPNY